MLALPIRFVLLRTQSAENLGACARALKNCGFQDWVHVQREVSDLTPARRTAVHATELLASATTGASLSESVSDCVWVVGTSSRVAAGKRRLSPREVAKEAVLRSAGGPVALVFGDERSGMRADEIERCHDLSAIPASIEQPSFNLAQAVLLYAYELRMAALAAEPPPPPPRAALATDVVLERLRRALEQTLTACRFLRDDRDALPRLFAPLRRAQLSGREAELWLSALGSLGRALRSLPQAPPPEKG